MRTLFKLFNIAMLAWAAAADDSTQRRLSKADKITEACGTMEYDSLHTHGSGSVTWTTQRGSWVFCHEDTTIAACTDATGVKNKSVQGDKVEFRAKAKSGRKDVYGSMDFSNTGDKDAFICASQKSDREIDCRSTPTDGYCFSAPTWKGMLIPAGETGTITVKVDRKNNWAQWNM